MIELMLVFSSYLDSLRVSSTEKWEEDSCDGYMVSWLGKACVFSTGVHRHASGDVSYRHLVTLQNHRRHLFK